MGETVMTLPAQDTEAKTYTESDLQHLVAREWAKNAITQLQNGQADLQKQLLELNTTFINEVRAFREALTGLPALISGQIRDCRDDMRREIDNDFPDKIANINMERRIESQIREGDAKIGQQLTEATVGFNERLEKIERKFDTLLTKIGIGIAVAIVLVGAFIWLLENISPTVLR